jgi:hypothetical protein
MGSGRVHAVTERDLILVGERAALGILRREHLPDLAAGCCSLEEIDHNFLRASFGMLEVYDFNQAAMRATSAPAFV